MEKKEKKVVMSAQVFGKGNSGKHPFNPDKMDWLNGSLSTVGNNVKTFTDKEGKENKSFFITVQPSVRGEDGKTRYSVAPNDKGKDKLVAGGKYVVAEPVFVKIVYDPEKGDLHGLMKELRRYEKGTDEAPAKNSFSLMKVKYSNIPEVGRDGSPMTTQSGEPMTTNFADVMMFYFADNRLAEFNSIVEKYQPLDLFKEPSVVEYKKKDETPEAEEKPAKTSRKKAEPKEELEELPMDEIDADIPF